MAQLKSELATQETSLQETLDAIKSPVKLGSTKEVQDRLMEGAIAIQTDAIPPTTIPGVENQISECGACICQR